MKQGGLLFDGGELHSLPLRAVRERPRPLPPLRRVYDSDPDETIVKIATGYQMIEYFPRNYPAWTAVGVTLFALPELGVEIRAVAVA